ncbi:MAG: tRNA pseudouridine(38-40) synthase TruA [Gammaproteobacteria bacterium]
MRYAACVEYCGTHYSGWQRQSHADSIQAQVEAALSAVADHSVAVTCAGRTDAGVHASYQVIHFDSDAQRQARSWVFGGNSNLPADISLTWVQPVAERFHARFSALRRRYHYFILNRESRPALAHQYLSWEYRPLDSAEMATAAACLIGEHDFTSFRAAGCQAQSPIRYVYDLQVSRNGSLLQISIEANAFLQQMVRNIVGVLLAIGSGKQPASWAAEVLAARDRECAGVTAPASGLYLAGVEYPPEYALPGPEQGAVDWLHSTVIPEAERYATHTG